MTSYRDVCAAIHALEALDALAVQCRALSDDMGRLAHVAQSAATSTCEDAGAHGAALEHELAAIQTLPTERLAAALKEVGGNFASTREYQHVSERPAMSCCAATL